MTFKDLLIQLDACSTAREWAGDMPIEEVVATCHRGDWLLWLAKKVDVDLRLRTLAKGHCANTIRHLMKDERSLNAVDVAIAFGEGKATREELDAAAAAAYVAYYAAAYAADAAAYAAAAAAYAADAAAYAAAAAAYAADAAAYAADAAYAAAAATAYAAGYASAADAYAADADAYAAAYAACAALNRQQTADICREYIGESLIQKVNQLL
jgi:hypothetical protein